MLIKPFLLIHFDFIPSFTINLMIDIQKRRKINVNFLSTMRYYNLDGTYEDYPLDNKFGWTFENIIIDEACPQLEANNTNLRDISRAERLAARTSNKDLSINGLSSISSSKTNDSDNGYGSDLRDSYDGLNCESRKPIKILKVNTDIKEETPRTLTIPPETVEGFRCRHCRLLGYAENCDIPSKEKLMALINPVNPESKALLSVVSYSKYKRLSEKETNEKVFRTLNFKTTNASHFISHNSPSRNESPNEARCPRLNFLLTESEAENSDKQLASEIRNYHETKEDHMLSLMMELVITDLNSSIGDMSELNNLVNDVDPASGVIDTSDLGTSIHSSIVSKEGSGSREKTIQNSYVDIPNRSSILSSIGLGDEIDRSIEYVVNEKLEMRRQMNDIRIIFEDCDQKLNSLMVAATSLEYELRETNFLDNLIHLLQGNLEKVRSKILPFQLFEKLVGNDDIEKNLIL
ncbi:hypothetical protein HUJ04_002943 [Dendroctonus ponderosae]|uniref:Uncharacterized protein n=2 Tax=Dendroctonus ponderosae TaxID=77166 RepID=A0AAR5PS36_DENPD|nr:hypothetical protein HUJ04_002943 [Dendroctonus ponderosae]